MINFKKLSKLWDKFLDDSSQINFDEWIGISKGKSVVELAKAGYNITCVDFSKKTINICKDLTAPLFPISPCLFTFY